MFHTADIERENLPDIEDLTLFSKALTGTKIICRDFSTSITEARCGDFMYLDPPYFYGNARNRGQYGWNTFSDDDVDRLIVQVKDASSKGVKILISYNKAHILKKALTRWKLSYCAVKRSVAGFSNMRSNVREFQLRNY